jgi:hypothetical protein
MWDFQLSFMAVLGVAYLGAGNLARLQLVLLVDPPCGFTRSLRR